MKQLIFSILLWSLCMCQTTSNLIFNNSFNSLNFERIKNELFANENRRNFSEPDFKLVDRNFRYDEVQCEKELVAIADSLQSSDFWALKRKLNWKSNKIFRFRN